MTTTITSSPWGRPIEIVYITQGIHYVHTRDHAGFHLSEQCLAEVPADWRRARGSCAGDETSPWFAADAEEPLVMLTFPDEFDLEDLNNARRAFDEFFAKITTTPRPEI